MNNSDGFIFNFGGPYFEDAVKADRYLFELAAYDITNGFIPLDSTQENVDNLQQLVAKKFNYFKKQIQSGETTIADLSKFIALKNGPFKKNKYTPEQMVESIIADSQKPENITGMNLENSGIIKKLIQDIVDQVGGSRKITLTTADKLLPLVDTGENNLEKNTENTEDKTKKKKKNDGKDK